MVGLSDGNTKLADTSGGSENGTQIGSETGDRRVLDARRGEEEEAVSTSIHQLPAGYKFAPTDQEIVGYFLLRRVAGGEMTRNPITECDGHTFYSTHPKDLVPKSREVAWYFYVRQEGDLHLRTTREVRDGAGTWRVIEPESQIHSEPNGLSIVGVKSVFAFFQQQRRDDDNNNYNRRLKKTHWTMAEYRLPKHDCYEEKEGTSVVLTRVNRGKQFDGCRGGAN